MTDNRPLIGITMGDPAGIGPEIIVKAASSSEIKKAARLVVIGDYGLIEKAAKSFSPSLKAVPVSSIDQPSEGESVNVLSLTELGDIPRGVASKEAGEASALYIREGAALALDGRLDAIVTAPINKESLNLGGCRYPGHTEYLAELTNTKDFAMMLMGERLRVILLTTHCPLMEVAAKLSRKETLRIIRLADRSLRDCFGLNTPRLKMAALNPHAGEGGLFGREEEEILLPALEAAKEEGIEIDGPFPSDSLFYSAVKNRNADAVICPYHDQGLIPLKLLHFDDGVNVTLGLPIIRTSPDHGTAFDIARKGIASPKSLQAAIQTAVSMVNMRKKASA